MMIVDDFCHKSVTAEAQQRMEATLAEVKNAEDAITQLEVPPEAPVSVGSGDRRRSLVSLFIICFECTLQYARGLLLAAQSVTVTRALLR